MNFTQLRCFIKAVDNSSFTIAAERLNFSQSAVSKNIKDLENTIGVTLINRAHHRISLTNAGKYFYRVARNVVDDMDYTVAYLQSQKNNPETLLRIGVCDTPLEQKILPIFLRKLRKSGSNLNVQFVFVLNNSIGELLNHHVDLCAIAREDVDVVDDVRFEPLISGRVVVACPEDSSLAKKAKITVADLRNQNIFLLDPNSSLNVQLNFQTALINNLGMEHIKFVQDFLAMDIYVRGGWGYGILPNFIADSQSAGITYVPIDYHDISPYGIAYMESFTNKSVLDEVVDTLKKSVKEYTQKNNN
ncbi:MULTISPECIES: LysR family transcriptional regulator [unclassified Lactobacillus]|uniref:LysR family transcriptional regulator n=1 Tax=unclassified Lactobacillus TaxID=2620435 RepID=UPI00226AD647|nr:MULTISPECIES: LysR family transcriptional regulator [unclassified Lactobacillus]MCX8720314.1 LysR family transcriptional regulator [Lactobacillus sp. B4010]MCX8732867.1 LysR family transcriptional regulator [Lactobacillus sp. B4015]MCX8735080.1 LysR family transcriptional regulator [Lactobacillus sp. B4012]